MKWIAKTFLVYGMKQGIWLFGYLWRGRGGLLISFNQLCKFISPTEGIVIPNESDRDPL
jgi:hypothetical protein